MGRTGYVLAVPAAFLAMLLLVSCGDDDKRRTPPPDDGGGVGGLPATASAARGGLLYDRWWVVNGAAQPASDHPAYPAAGQQSGASTWRCKECHGWDYLGVDGAYGSGSHFTGIAGVLPAAGKDAMTVFNAIKSGPNHDFSGVLSDDDVWDLTAFILTGLIDMRMYIDASKQALGNAAAGQTLYEGTAQCSIGGCHGSDGYALDFGGGEGVADIAVDNPWEALHKIRWGNPGTAMPSGVADTMLSVVDQVDVLTHAQTLLPAGASVGRGGLLYDKWWAINGAAEPATTHPSYPAVGTQTGSATWRCKECHGWDYLGVDGAYGSGSHFSGIAGILGAQADAPRAIFDTIRTGPGHDFTAELSEADVWDLVAFVKTGLIDMRNYIDASKNAMGNAAAGQALYDGVAGCALAGCHGADGKAIDFGGGEGIGDLADGNPWETLHKIRWGNPATAMPSGVVDTMLSTTDQVDVLTYAQTLPTIP